MANKKEVTVKATEEKKTAAASAEVKPAEKKEAVKKAAPAKKPAAKKAPAKKAAEVNFFVQFMGAEVSYADIVERAKNESGVKSPKNVNVYVKPEENMVYYVVDETEGKFVLA